MARKQRKKPPLRVFSVHEGNVLLVYKQIKGRPNVGSYTVIRMEKGVVTNTIGSKHHTASEQLERVDKKIADLETARTKLLAELGRDNELDQYEDEARRILQEDKTFKKMICAGLHSLNNDVAGTTTGIVIVVAQNLHAGIAAAVPHNYLFIGAIGAIILKVGVSMLCADVT